MSSKSGQKFIGRNRPPRVQIEYDVETYGANKKVELPFIMGVTSDLSGDSKIEKDKLNDRNFKEFDIDNFDDRMQSIKPGVKFNVPNKLTGDGELLIDIDFESMDDFQPGQVVNKVEAMAKLMKARKELQNLLAYVDGKADAEELVSKIIQDSELLKNLVEAADSKNKKEDSLT